MSAVTAVFRGAGCSTEIAEPLQAFGWSATDGLLLELDESL